MDGDEALIHIFYFLSEDEAEVARCWKRIQQEVKGQETEMLQEHKGVMLVKAVRAEGVEVYLYLRKRTVALRLVLHSPEEHVHLLGRIREAASSEFSLMLGETIIFLSQEREKVEKLYGGIAWRRSELPLGELYFLEAQNDRKSYLMLSPLPGQEFFMRFIYADLLDRKIEREAGLFMDMLESVRDKRRKCERHSSRLLDARGETLEDFERLVKELCTTYIELARYLEWVNSRVSMLKEDLHEFSGEVRWLVSGEDEVFSERIEKHRYALETLLYERENFILAHQKVKNALDVVGMRIEIERGRETVELQQESISLQVAAGFIEFIVVFYYTLNSWKILGKEAFAALPAWLVLLVMTAFSSSVVLFTHAVAVARRRGRKFTYGMVASLVLIVVVALVMLLVTIRSS
ncbi:MAG: hypothetical protein GXN98_01340 [Euryarchaeota archaeon]|nr:hypothetical protein [Euryarchaeota archaeon]